MKMKLKKNANELSEQPKLCKSRRCNSPLRSNSNDKYCAQCRSRINAKNQERLTAAGVGLMVVGAAVAKKLKPAQHVVAFFKQFL